MAVCAIFFYEMITLLAGAAAKAAPHIAKAVKNYSPEVIKLASGNIAKLGKLTRSNPKWKYFWENRDKFRKK